MKPITKKISAGLVILAIILTVFAVHKEVKSEAAPTMTDYQNLIFLYNYELKQLGTLQLPNATSSNILPQINTKIINRAVLGNIQIMEADGLHNMTATEYINYRANLITKTSK